MGGIGAVISSALSSLQANQLGISVTSNNIANANNLNYSRQRMITTPVIDLLGTSGGLGVQVMGVEALRDGMVQRRLIQEDAAKAGAETLHQALSDIEVFFNDSDGHGLQQYLANFFNSFQTLSTDPSSMSFRELVRSGAGALTSAIGEVRTSLASMQTQANTDVSRLVTTVNTLAAQIATVSGQIRIAENTGEAHELRDQRTALVRQLSEIAEVRELESDGTYQLTIGGNRLLVLENKTFPLTTTVDTSGYTRVFSQVDDITSELTNGKLGAHLQLRDAYIPTYLGALDNLAYSIVQEVNARHLGGYDLQGNTGIPFFEPLAGPNQAAALMTLSAAVTADLRSIAASGEANGFGNQAAIQLGNLIFDPVTASGSLVDQYGSLVFSVGNDVSGTEIGLREHEALSTQLEMRRQAMSGVSIDEETVQMLQFQRAYEASAQLLRAVDEMLQAILAIGR